MSTTNSTNNIETSKQPAKTAPQRAERALGEGSNASPMHHPEAGASPVPAPPDSAPTVAAPTRTIAHYGDRADVKELAARIKLAVPGGRKLNDEEALSLAQTAQALDLNPLNGEVWMIPSSGPMVGIKGLRRAAQQQAAREGGTFWTEMRQIIDPAELKRLGIPESAICFECRLMDSATIRGYADSIAALTKAGIPFDQAQQIIGQRPTTLGYGFWTPDEPTKMKPVQAAMKRAEADAIKRRYSINLAFGDADDSPTVMNAPTIDAEVVDAPCPTTRRTMAEIRGFDKQHDLV